MPDTTIQVVLNVSAESVKIGDRVWLDCVVTGDADAKIEFSKVDAAELPSNAQVGESATLSETTRILEALRILEPHSPKRFFHLPPSSNPNLQVTECDNLIGLKKVSRRKPTNIVIVIKIAHEFFALFYERWCLLVVSLCAQKPILCR